MGTFHIFMFCLLILQHCSTVYVFTGMVPNICPYLNRSQPVGLDVDLFPNDAVCYHYST